jgi:hypothetical protein
MPHTERRPIADFDGYYVDTEGGVWGNRPHPTNPDGEMRLIKPCAGEFGHLFVGLCHERHGRKTRFVHRLVLEAFVGPCPDGMEGCHNDGNPANNRLDNLRWDTPSANYADRYKHGTHLLGTRNGNAKLSEEDVRTMFDLRRRGWEVREIGKRFGITKGYASKILCGRSWKHLGLFKEESL